MSPITAAMTMAPPIQVAGVGRSAKASQTHRGARGFSRRLCLDWTERRHHLGGYLGARLTDLMLGRGYLRRGEKRRSLMVTPAGARFFCDELGISVDGHHGSPE